MLMPIPLSNLNPCAVVQPEQNIQLVVEIVEYNHSWPRHANIKDFLLPAPIRVDQFPQRIAKLAGRFDGFVLPRIPAVLADLQILRLRSVYKELHPDHETGAADNK